MLAIVWCEFKTLNDEVNQVTILRKPVRSQGRYMRTQVRSAVELQAKCLFVTKLALGLFKLLTIYGIPKTNKTTLGNNIEMPNNQT